MNKSILCTLAAILLFFFFPAQAFSSTPKDSTASFSAKPIELVKSEVLIARLNEIKSVNKSNLNFSEKRQLRKETRSIKKELQQLNGGVYISAGAVILILVLLIILL